MEKRQSAEAISDLSLHLDGPAMKKKRFKGPLCA